MQICSSARSPELEDPGSVLWYFWGIPEDSCLGKGFAALSCVLPTVPAAVLGMLPPAQSPGMGG